MNRIQTPAHKGIVIALLPLSTLAALASLDADKRAEAIPATRLTGIGYDEASGSVQLAWIDNSVEIGNDGKAIEIDIDGKSYKAGINGILVLEGGAKLLIEDAELAEANAQYLADSVLPILIDQATGTIIGADNDSIVSMPTPAHVVDRARLVKPDGASIVFQLDNVGTRLTASIALDEVDGAEYVLIAGEGSSEVYAAKASLLAEAEADAAECFNLIGVIDGKQIARLAKPEDGKVEATLADGSKLVLAINDGQLEIDSTDAIDAQVAAGIGDSLETDEPTAEFEAADGSDTGDELDAGIRTARAQATAPKASLADDVVGNPWEVIGRTRAVTTNASGATRASVQQNPAGGYKLRFEKLEAAAA